MTRLEPDKVRFVDPDARTSRHPIFAVDLSDDRSARHFLTFWCKGKTLRDAWAIANGIDPDNHDRDVYHRDGPWIPETFPGMESAGWGKHCHLDLARPPAFADIEPFAADIPANVLAEIRAYFGVPPAAPV